MATYRLKAANEADMLAALKGALLTDSDGELITATHDYWLYLIPELLAPTGKMLFDDDGNEYPEKLPLKGYHANLTTGKLPIINALKSITISVNKPLLKVAGEK